MTVLENNTRITREGNDPEKRKYAIQAIEALFFEVGFESAELDDSVINKIFDILAVTIEDYTMDKRGDIGSIVREQSMTTMLTIVHIYC